MPRATRLHAHTPTLSAVDPRGLPVRTVAYCRELSRQAAEARITRQVYDGAGRRVGNWDPRLWGLSPKPNLTSVYRLSGQPLLTDSLDAGWQLNLPAVAGQVLSAWDSRGSQQHTQHDALLRPLAVREAVAGEAARFVERMTYAGTDAAAHNQCGRLIRHDDPAGTLHLRDYGLDGTALAEQRQFLASLEPPDWPIGTGQRDDLLEPGPGFTSRQTHIATGQLHNQTDAMGHLRSFTYTRAGQLKSASLRLVGAGQVPRLLVSALAYDAFGQVEEETAGNDVQTRAEYDPRDGRLLHLRAAAAQVLADVHYTYDPMGNVLSIEDQAQPVRYHGNRRIEPINRYQYDTLYQLVQASGREVITPAYGPQLPALQPLPADPNQLRNYTQAFTYDAAGNLRSRQHSGAPTFVMAVSQRSNRSLAQRPDGGLPGEDDIAQGFDAQGNQQTLQPGQALHWDARNQLSRVTQVQRPDGTDDEEHYVYDRPGHRLRKVRLAQAHRRTLRGEVRYLPGLETHQHGAERYHVIHLEAGRNSVRVLHWETAPPAGVTNDQLRYGISDHLGSCTLEVDEHAALISQESYYPFGGTAWWAGRSAVQVKHKTVRYSGKERDATGLYYYGYRYYAPWLQRWLSADPAGEVDGLNFYWMVNNRPTYLTDKKGLVGGNDLPVPAQQLGRWKLEKLELSHSALKSRESEGHDLKVRLVLSYKGRWLDKVRGRMEEPPALTWDESIHVNDLEKKESWQFNVNMYEHNPSSRTLEAWPRRYIEAYNTAAGQPGLQRGSVRLLDVNDSPVSIAKLGEGVEGNENKANAVRSYLIASGGKLEFEIHDVPSIVLRENTHKERLLQISIGLQGAQGRALFSQYLLVDNTHGEVRRESTVNAEYIRMDRAGLVKVEAPSIVRTPRAYIRMPGEYV